jgi:hypothetical protein
VKPGVGPAAQTHNPCETPDYAMFPECHYWFGESEQGTAPCNAGRAILGRRRCRHVPEFCMSGCRVLALPVETGPNPQNAKLRPATQRSNQTSRTPNLSLFERRTWLSQGVISVLSIRWLFEHPACDTAWIFRSTNWTVCALIHAAVPWPGSARSTVFVMPIASPESPGLSVFSWLWLQSTRQKTARNSGL